MKALVIIAGVLLILGGWAYSIFADYNAPTDAAGKKGCGVMIVGVALIVAAIAS